MKKLALATIVAALLITAFLFYKGYFTTKPTLQHKIVGSWKVDSVTSVKSSASLVELLFAFDKVNNDSVMVNFNNDSTYTETSKQSTKNRKYYLQNDSLFLQADSANFEKVVIKFNTQNTAILSFIDSTNVYIQRLSK